MYKSNGRASRSYTTSQYHQRGGSRPNALSTATPLAKTRICERCNKGIYGRNTGKMRIHRECKTPEEREQALKKRSWTEDRKRHLTAWKAAHPDTPCPMMRTGRKKAQALDPNVELPHPLLVVKKPLSLTEVMHRYVASVLVECKGNITAARKTLGVSAQSIQRCIRRIESGDLNGVDPVRAARRLETWVVRKAGANAETREAVQPVPGAEQDEGLPEVRNAG